MEYLLPTGPFTPTPYTCPTSFVSHPVQHSDLILSPSSPVMLYPCAHPTSALLHVLGLLSGIPFFPSLPGEGSVLFILFNFDSIIFTFHFCLF